MEVVPTRRALLATTGTASLLALFSGMWRPATRHVVQIGKAVVPATRHFVHTVATGTCEAVSILTSDYQSEAPFVASPSALAVVPNPAPDPSFRTWLPFVITWLHVHGWFTPSPGISNLFAHLDPEFFHSPRDLVEYLITIVILAVTAVKTGRALWRIPKVVWHWFVPSNKPKDSHRVDPMESIAMSLSHMARSCPAHDVRSPLTRFLAHLTEPFSWINTIGYVIFRMLTWTPILTYTLNAAGFHILKFVFLVALHFVTYPIKGLVVNIVRNFWPRNRQTRAHAYSLESQEHNKYNDKIIYFSSG